MEHKSLQDCYLSCVEVVKPKNLINKSIKFDIENTNVSFYNQDGEVKFLTNYLQFKEIMIVGGGKASGEMALSLLSLLKSSPLSSLPIRGVISVLNNQTFTHIQSENISLEFIYASHPIPDINSVNASKKILNLVKDATNKTLIISLLSGGGSALICSPSGDVTMEEKQLTTKLLLSSGASINEINTVRKHMSDFKGGNMAKMAVRNGGILISLILSDVINDIIEVIASGPTAIDNTTFNDTLLIIDKYQLRDSIPWNVLAHFNEGSKGNRSETLKETDKEANNIHNLIIGSAKDTRKQAISFMNNNNHPSFVWSDAISGEASTFGETLIDLIQSLVDQYSNSITGEFTVSFNTKTTGLGGRNQEMLLSLLIKLQSSKKLPAWHSLYNYSILSAAYDGIEGNSPSAGAFVDSNTFSKLNEKGINLNDLISYLDNHDSYSFFSRIGNDITIGNTGTNVNDMTLILLQKK